MTLHLKKISVQFKRTATVENNVLLFLRKSGFHLWGEYKRVIAFSLTIIVSDSLVSSWIRFSTVLHRSVLTFSSFARGSSSRLLASFLSPRVFSIQFWKSFLSRWNTMLWVVTDLALSRKSGRFLAIRPVGFPMAS